MNQKKLDINTNLNDLEIVEGFIKETMKIAKLKDLEILSYLKRTLSVVRKLKDKYDNTYSVEQTAQIFNCSKKTIYRMISNGKLRAIKKGKYYFIYESSIDKYIFMKNKEKNVDVSSLEALGLVKGGN